jgi:predicted nucleic acid-binding protein
MERVFLDANVLFSAAYKQTRLRSLWTLSNVTLITSSYAVAEAETNLAKERPEALIELENLLHRVMLVKTLNRQALPVGITLEKKDQPILLAAIDAQATHLLTGDIKHFGHLFGVCVEGVLILTPAQYFQKSDRSEKSL